MYHSIIQKEELKLTKYFNLQPSVKPTKVTRPKVIEKKHLYQSPMHNFLSMVSTFANIKPGQTIDQLIEIITIVPLLRWNTIDSQQNTTNYNNGTPIVRKPIEKMSIIDIIYILERESSGQQQPSSIWTPTTLEIPSIIVNNQDHERPMNNKYNEEQRAS